MRAQRPDGLFHNIADVRGAFVDDVGSEDSIGRALWACGRAVEFGGVPEWSVAARSILARSAPAVERLRANHARAYAVLGLCSALTSRADELPSALRSMLGRALATLSEDLVRDFHAFATDDWSWWTESLTWGNGRLPEAMLAAAVSGGSKRCESVGMRSLEFLAQITQPHGLFVPACTCPSCATSCPRLPKPG